MAVVDRPYKSELLWRIRDALERELRTDIPVGDSARVSKVVISKYTGELRGIILSVHGDHPLGFDAGKHDAIAEGTPRSFQDRPWMLPPESVGGSQWDRVYGTVQVRALIEKSPQSAVVILDTVLTRIKITIDDALDIVPFVDAYGVQVFNLRTASRYGYASGGDTTAVDSHWCDFIARCSRRRSRA